jgi:hypothetical protein
VSARSGTGHSASQAVVSRSAEQSAGCAQLLVTMLVAIEESGNFGFPEDGRFESYILIAVIAPDSAMPDVRKTAAALRRTMRARELKANKLGGRRLAPVADAVGQLPLQAVAYAVDTRMMDRRFIAEFRMKQAIRIARVRDQLLERGPVAPHVLAEIDELLRVVGQPGARGAMSHAEFVQYQAMPDLLVSTINRAVAAFHGPRWDADHGHLAFVFDRKLPDRLNAGERYFDEQGMRIIGSNARFSISLPQTWRDRPDHPFRVTFEHEEEDHLDVKKLLSDCTFADSEDDDLLQFADVIAGVVRRAIETPDPADAPAVHRAIATLRPVLANVRGDLVRIFRLTGASSPDADRYNAVLNLTAAATTAPSRGPGGAVLLNRDSTPAPPRLGPNLRPLA